VRPQSISKFICSLAIFLAIAAPGCNSNNAGGPPPPPSNPVPAISGLSPSSALAGSGQQTLTINGSNFLSSSTVTFSSAAHPATFVSSTQLTISLSAADQSAAGNFGVVVTNPTPGGGASNPGNFTVNNPLPVLNSISPTVLAVGSPITTIAIAGSGFVSTSGVTVGGTKVTSTFVSASQLTASIPPSLLAAAGTQSVMVTNAGPGGGASGPEVLSIVTVASITLLATPVAPNAANGPWTLAAAALDPNGKPVANLPINFSSSSGQPSTLAGVTSANGGLTSSIPPPTPGGSAQPVVVTATAGGQTAAVNIVFQNLAAGSVIGRRSSGSGENSTPQASASRNLQSFAIGASGSPSSTNPFLNPNNCFTDAALTTTVSTVCQQIYTQNNLNIQPSNLINEACNAISSIGTLQDELSCVGTGVTVISCLLGGTGIGAVICAGTLDFTLDSLGPECAQFIATQLTQRFLGDATAQVLQQVFILQDPLNPQNLITEGCIALQGIFPPTSSNSAGRIYVVDASANSLQVYDSQGKTVPVSGAFAGLNTPDGIAYDPSNQHIYVANLGSNSVTVYDTSGNTVNLGINAFAGLNDPEDITFNPVNRHLYINEPNQNQVLVFDEVGNQISLASGTFQNLNLPFGVGWDSSNGLIYVTNAGNNTITVFDQDGNSVQTAAGAFPGLSSPDDVSWDPITGNLYVTGAFSSFGACSVNQVFVFTSDGTPVTTSGGFPGLNGPDSIVSSGNAVTPMYYVTNICGGTIGVFDKQGNPITMPAGAFANLVQPSGIVVVP